MSGPDFAPDPFADDPYLRELDGELNLASNQITDMDLLRDRLDTARTLENLEEVVPGTVLAVDVERQPESPGIDRLHFYRSAEDPIPGESGWWWLPPGQESEPNPWRRVTMVGAHIPDTLIGVPGLIKLGYGFSFYETHNFRSSIDTPGAFVQQLPPPEHLDQHTLAACLKQGIVVLGLDRRLYWHMPTEVFDTGPVLEVTRAVGSDLG